MNTATPPPPGPSQPSAADARIPGHDQPPLCSSMPPGWTGLAGRVAEAIEQALPAAPGDATRSSMASVSIRAFTGPDTDLTTPPTWWLDWRARVVQTEIDHRTDAATAAVALVCMHV